MREAFRGSVRRHIELLAKINQIDDDVTRAIAGGIVQGSELVHATATKSLYAHESFGRTYKRGGVTHTASAPGNPPNSDTGDLAKSLGIEFDESDVSGYVGTNEVYGKYLEFGTSKMAARPWLFPAMEMNREQIQDILIRAIQDAVRKGAAA